MVRRTTDTWPGRVPVPAPRLNHYRLEIRRRDLERAETLAKLAYELRLAVAQIDLAIAARRLG